ncbi:polyphosphate kinase 2 family protein [Aquimarina sp. BL5]|uniref:PPK2 family polyphosphate kinase n=1 Tax=Aquimarina sp. BL5 TaxID=1714860 RepID=UPI000E481E65|nr:PPK2 family polyphosphate kinase [Aquimarina sp. BL5]AXT53260.1 polyphosphate kinase 2 family protein [Aquimarina sp. BL5]RKN01570.1 polyphosphate kinase 2 family protein [Aquimarina sp. BL5]
MNKINHEDFRVSQQIELSKIPTTYDLGETEKKVEKELEKVREKLGEFQDTIYAHDKYAILICLQGMDTAGKDSLIREVFKDFNTRGIVVHSFKVPTELELGHDYLWRHYIALPQRGRFSVFNRTHYENVLVTRVHPQYIMGEKLPSVNSVEDIDDVFWEKRFEQIRNFEKHIAENGTLIYKFYLHLSKDEQKNRLLRRLEKKEKNWKFSSGDLKERKLWDKYQSCYQDAINKTSLPHAPWYIIPADNKPVARYIVAKTLYDTLKGYDDIREPELDKETKSNIELYKEQLENE